MDRTQDPLRYEDAGELHLDFHGALNTTLDYVVDRYGEDALHQILFRTGHDVYADLRDHLRAGDREELVRHWRHYFDREGAEYTIAVTEDEIVLTMKTCPAVRHVKRLGLPLSKHFCDQTEHVNRGLCDGTPFEIVTRLTGEGSCVQTLRRRRDPQ